MANNSSEKVPEVKSSDFHEIDGNSLIGSSSAGSGGPEPSHDVVRIKRKHVGRLSANEEEKIRSFFGVHLEPVRAAGDPDREELCAAVVSYKVVPVVRKEDTVTSADPAPVPSADDLAKRVQVGDITWQYFMEMRRPGDSLLLLENNQNMRQ